MKKYSNENTSLIQKMIQKEKTKESIYRQENPNSLLIFFENEIKEKGYEFEILDQVRNFLPKHKNDIVPLALELYEKTNVEIEKRYFLSLFHFKGFEECVSVLLKDMDDTYVSDQLKALICETLRAIHSSKYIEDYLKILSMGELSDARNPIIVLLGDFKVDKAIPHLISALDEGKNITTNALEALGKYKSENLRRYFEKYLTHENKYYRREAEKAIKKLDG